MRADGESHLISSSAEWMRLIHVIWFLLTAHYIASSWTSKKPDNASAKKSRKSHSCNVQGPFMNEDYWETHCFLSFRYGQLASCCFWGVFKSSRRCKLARGNEVFDQNMRDMRVFTKGKWQRRFPSRQISENWKDLNNTDKMSNVHIMNAAIPVCMNSNVAAPWMKVIFWDFL